MKKFFAIMGIIAGVLLGLGVIIGTIGLVGGGFKSVRTAFWNQEFSWKIPGLSKEVVLFGNDGDDLDNNVNSSANNNSSSNSSSNSDNDDWDWFDDDTWNWSVATGILDDKYPTYTDGTYKFDMGSTSSKLEIAMGGGDLNVVKTTDDRISIEVSLNGEIQCYEKGSTLYINCALKKGFEGCDVTVYLPENLEFQEYDIELGAGVVIIDEITARELDISAGAGAMTIEKAVCDEVDVSIGAGEVRLNDITAGKLDCSLGMGEIYAAGEVTGEVDIECSMGTVTLMLDGGKEDFDYEIECAMGSVTVGSEVFADLTAEKNINNSAAKKMKLECSMGNITVTFK